MHVYESNRILIDRSVGNNESAVDIYGLGVRIGFYLQSVAVTITTFRQFRNMIRWIFSAVFVSWNTVFLLSVLLIGLRSEVYSLRGVRVGKEHIHYCVNASLCHSHTEFVSPNTSRGIQSDPKPPLPLTFPMKKPRCRRA